MRAKSTDQITKKPSLLYKPYPEPPVLGRLFKKRGAFDGKLFYAAKKATYTFVDQKEVIALHFDKERKAIFYKGHNISNLKLTEEQLHHLELFREELTKNPKTHSMVSSYATALDAYLSSPSLTSFEPAR